ncbi:MAG: Fic family protein [Bacilli bacterium]|nr:Fic family protein [Bacilli bacterium]
MKDPYVYEDTNVLINLANIKDQKELDNYETTLSRIAIVEILNKPIEINNINDIFLIHKRLFKEVYSWAGKPRTINIYKEEPVLSGLSVNYSDHKTINNDLNRIQKSVESINIIKLSKKELIHQIAVIIASIWQVHAFREGNTRTICLYLYFLMKKYDLKLNIDFIGEHSKFFRNALVLASIGEYSEYEHLEMILSDAVSLKKIIDNEKRYQTIRDYSLEKYEYNYHHLKKD